MKKADKIAKTAFILYAALMLWLLFGQRIGNDVWGGYSDRIFENINLMPFETIGKYARILKNGGNAGLVRHAFINLGGNIVMFIPLGLLLPLMTDRAKSPRGCAAVCLVILVCIEAAQLFTLLGSFDIDDIIFNMAGVLIGYIIYNKYISKKPSL